MNLVKSKSVVQWFNSISASEPIENLLQLHDASHFYQISKKIESSDEDIESVEAKYAFVEKCINKFYNTECRPLLNFESCRSGSLLELGKVAILLLTALVDSMLLAGDESVSCLYCLKLQVQQDIREIMAAILKQNDSCSRSLSSNFADVLISARMPVSEASNVAIENLDSFQTPCRPKKGRKRTYVAKDSPLKMWFDSPQMMGQLTARRKEFELCQLKKQLNDITNHCSEMETKMDSMSALIEKKDQNIKELDRLLAQMRRQQAAASPKTPVWLKSVNPKSLEADCTECKFYKDSMEKSNADYEKLSKELADKDGTLSKFEQTWKDLRDENESLRQKINSLEDNETKLKDSITRCQQNMAVCDQSATMYKSKYEEIKMEVNSRMNSSDYGSYTPPVCENMSGIIEKKNSDLMLELQKCKEEIVTLQCQFRETYDAKISAESEMASINNAHIQSMSRISELEIKDKSSFNTINSLMCDQQRLTNELSAIGLQCKNLEDFCSTLKTGASFFRSENDQLKKKLELCETSLHNAGKEKSSLICDIGLLRQNYEGLELTLSSLNNEFEEAKRMLTSVGNEMTALNQKYETAVNSEAHLKKELESTECERDALSREIASLKQETLQKSVDLATAKVADENLRAKIAEFEASVEDFRCQNSHLFDQLNKVKEVNENLERDLSSFKANLRNMCDELSDKKSKIVVLSQCCAEMDSEKSDLRKQLTSKKEELDASCRVMNKKMASLERDSLLKSEELENLKADAAESKAKLLDYEASLKHYNDENGALATKVDALQRANEQLKSDVSVSEQHLRQRDESLADARNKMALLNEKHVKVCDVKSDLNAKLKFKEKEFKRVKEELSLLTNENLDSSLELQSVKLELENLRGKSAEDGEAINGLRGQIAEKDGILRSLKAPNESVNTQVLNLRNELAKYYDAIQNQGTMVEQFEQQITDLEKRNEQLDSVLSENTLKMKESEEINERQLHEIGDLRMQLENACSSAGNMEQEISTLQSTVRGLQERCNSAKDLSQTFEEANLKLSSTNRQNEEALKSAKLELNQLYQLRDNFYHLQTVHDELLAKFSALKDDNDFLSGELKRCNEGYAEEVHNLKSDVCRLERDKLQMIDDLGVEKDKVISLCKELAELTSLLSEVEASKRTLGAEKDSLMNELAQNKRYADHEIELLKTNIWKLERERDDVVHLKTNDDVVITDMSEEIVQLRSSLSLLGASNQSLQVEKDSVLKELSESQSEAANEVQMLKSTILTLQMEKEDIVNKKATCDDEIANLNGEIIMLRSSLSDLGASEQSLLVEKDSLMTELLQNKKNADNEIELLQSSISKLEMEKCDIVNRKAADDTIMANLSQEIAQLRSFLTELEASKQSLHAENESLRNELSQYRSNADNKIQSLADTILKLRTEKDDIVKEIVNNDDLTANLSREIAQLEASKQSLERNILEKDSLLEGAQKEIIQQSTHCAQLTQRNEDQLRSLTAFESDCRQLGTSKRELQQIIEQHVSEIASLREEVQLKQSSEKSEADASSAEFESLLADANRERENLQGRLEDMERSMRCLSESKELAEKEYFMCVEEKAKKIESLEKQLVEVKASEKTEGAADVTELQKQVDSKTAEIGNLLQLKGSLEEKLASTKDAQEKLGIENWKLKQSEKKYKDEVLRYHKEMISIRESVKARNTKYEEHLNVRQEQFERLKAKCDKTKSQLGEMEQKNRENEHLIKNYSDKLGTYRAKAEAKKLEEKKMWEELQSIKKNNEKLFQDLEEAQKTISPLKGKIEGLLEAKRTLLQENVSLNAQLKFADSQLRELSRAERERSSPSSYRRHTLMMSQISNEIVPSPLLAKKRSNTDLESRTVLVKKNSRETTETYLIPARKASECDNSSLDGSTVSDSFSNRGVIGNFTIDDEEEFFDASSLQGSMGPPPTPGRRANELARRNTLCLPHMKSAYPVELFSPSVTRESRVDSRLSQKRKTIAPYVISASEKLPNSKKIRSNSDDTQSQVCQSPSESRRSSIIRTMTPNGIKQLFRRNPNKAANPSPRKNFKGFFKF